MALTQIDDRGLKTPIDLIDNEKIRLGTGNDLELWHQTGNSYITSTGANLTLRAVGHLYLQDIDGNTMADFNDGGSVELYDNGTKKFETTSAGVSTTGTSLHTDNIKITVDNGAFYCGAGDDLGILHDGTDTTITNNTGNLLIYSANDFYIKHGTEVMFAAKDDGAVELYHDGTQKLATGSGGIVVSGSYYTNDGNYIYLGSDNDLRIYHDGSNSYIDQSGAGDLYIRTLGSQEVIRLNASKDIELRVASGNDVAAKFIGDGAVELYYDNAKKFETYSSGCLFQGNIKADQDDATLVLGAGSDLQLWHSGSDSYIKNTAGKLFFQNDAHFWFRKNNGNNALYIDPDGVTILYNNSAAKLETSGSGITVTGTVTETSDVALKKDITPLSDSLAKVKQLKGYSYKFKETDIEAIGFTAQDVEKIYPALVEGEEGKKGLNYSGLIAPLLEAVKELSAKVETLETKVAALEAA